MVSEMACVRKITRIYAMSESVFNIEMSASLYPASLRKHCVLAGRLT